MCRFLLIKSKKKLHPQKILHAFASMAEKSKSPDGDWQGDGWGIAWINQKLSWQRYTSVLPVWNEKKKFIKFPQSNLFVVHARSATFPNQKGILEYNQPYIAGNYAYVFNGYLKGVSFPYSISGKIGAQKIWHLLQEELKRANPEKALENIKTLLLQHSKEIVGLNIGLVSQEEIYSLNYFTKNPEYYQLQYFQNKNVQAICSERLDWTILKN